MDIRTDPAPTPAPVAPAPEAASASPAPVETTPVKATPAKAAPVEDVPSRARRRLRAACFLIPALSLAIAYFLFFADIPGAASPPQPVALPRLAYSTPAPPLGEGAGQDAGQSIIQPPVAPASPPEGLIQATVLQEGVEDPVVATLQTRLMELGYFDHDMVTDYYGPATGAAVQLFQRVQGMAQTGVADSFLQDLIFSDGVIPYHMKQGDEGSDIEAMQSRLQELGYVKKSDVTGLFGEKTQQAVLTFQKRNKLTQDGVLDLAAIDLLYSFKARPRVDPTPTPTPKPTPVKGTSSGVEGMIAAAEAHLGKPYVWGGNGPDSFDCSGLLYYCLRQVNKDVGRVRAVHYSQFGDWKEITSLKDCVRGDFLFFRSDTDPEVNHTGIYLGSGKFIHASFKAGKVRTDKTTDEYFARNFVNARRVFY